MNTEVLFPNGRSHKALKSFDPNSLYSSLQVMDDKNKISLFQFKHKTQSYKLKVYKYISAV